MTKIKTVVWSDRSKKDLRSIKDFFDNRNGNTAYSNKLLRLFRSSIKLLENHPLASIQTDMEDVRGLIVLDYILFFSIQEKHLVVLGVWDTRRDPDQLSDFLNRKL